MFGDYYTLEKIACYLKLDELSRLSVANNAFHKSCSSEELWFKLCQRDFNYKEPDAKKNAKEMYRLLRETTSYVFLIHSYAYVGHEPIVIKYCKDLGEAFLKLNAVHPEIFTGRKMFDTDHISLELKEDGILMQTDDADRKEWLGCRVKENPIPYDHFYNNLEILKWRTVDAPGDMFETRTDFPSWIFLFQQIEIGQKDLYLVESVYDYDDDFEIKYDIRTELKYDEDTPGSLERVFPPGHEHDGLSSFVFRKLKDVETL